MEIARREEPASVNDWIMLAAIVALLSPILVAFSALVLLVLATASPLLLLLPLVPRPALDELDEGEMSPSVRRPDDHGLLPAL